MDQAQSPIFTKSYDLLVWLLKSTEKFPKNERFRLARRLEDSAFAFYELLMQAVHTPNTRTNLLQADLELEKLRLYLRLCQARELMSKDQYQYAARVSVEIGKLLGGWLKKVGNGLPRHSMLMDTI